MADEITTGTGTPGATDTAPAAGGATPPEGATPTPEQQTTFQKWLAGLFGGRETAPAGQEGDPAAADKGGKQEPQGKTYTGAARGAGQGRGRRQGSEAGRPGGQAAPAGPEGRRPGQAGEGGLPRWAGRPADLHRPGEHGKGPGARPGGVQDQPGGCGEGAAAGQDPGGPWRRGHG